MITRQQVQELLQYPPSKQMVTSCYLNLDRSGTTAQALKIRTKDLLQTAARQLAHKAATHEQRESLRRDFERIEEFVLEQLGGNGFKALAIFSSSSQELWQAYRLPHLQRNILVADATPYVRPLAAVLGEHHRFCVALVDRQHGRIFEMFLGEILEHTELVDDVPRRVHEGGFQGREERSIERHHDEAVHHHFQRIAEQVFNLFKRDHFDYLILGGHQDLLGEFQTTLHPYLRERLCGKFTVDPSKISIAEVLQRSLAIEERVERDRELKLAGDLVRQADAGRRAVSGVGDTVKALARGEARLFVVEEGFELPGHVCPACHHISTEPMDCPLCHRPTEPCADIVDEAVQLASLKNCQIEHVRGMTPLHDAGRMGALLRYQT
jgi:peptide subunit release factor 1 (eRF1)